MKNTKTYKALNQGKLNAKTIVQRAEHKNERVKSEKPVKASHSHQSLTPHHPKHMNSSLATLTIREVKVPKKQRKMLNHL